MTTKPCDDCGAPTTHRVFNVPVCPACDDARRAAATAAAKPRPKKRRGGSGGPTIKTR